MTVVIKLTVNTQMQTYYNLTAAKIDDIKDTNGAFFSFTSLPVTNGALSLSYRFF
jgi:hypothetical protein